MAKEKLNAKGYDAKSGWMGFISDEKKQLFPTEKEYDEFIADLNKGDD